MDPLKQAMASADSMRRQLNSMMRRGSRGIKAALPTPPEGFPIDLPVIPDFELPALPALPTNGLPVPPEGAPAFPEFPTNGFPALPTLPELPVLPTAPEIPVPAIETVEPESVVRSMERQVSLRPLNHAGIGRRF
ncbi:hypothetical protein D4R42_02450 [bacterium]|nr:MAG: hypothetical protein D4R42_02450 [bacterium]